jgi:hypothetical protein
MRHLLIALLAAPIAAQGAEPPPTGPNAEVMAAQQRFAWASQVQVIQIRVRHVEPPRPEPGDCVVSGVVEAVWQGDAYQAGDDVTVRVACNSTPQLQGGDKYDGAGAVDPRVVMQAARACVHIRRNGQLFWSVGGRRPGPCDHTTGYTPLDPPPLRLDPGRPGAG